MKRARAHELLASQLGADLVVHFSTENGVYGVEPVELNHILSVQWFLVAPLAAAVDIGGAFRLPPALRALSLDSQGIMLSRFRLRVLSGVVARSGHGKGPRFGVALMVSVGWIR